MCLSEGLGIVLDSTMMIQFQFFFGLITFPVKWYRDNYRRDTKIIGIGRANEMA